jgi:hypothetical protein
MRWSGSCVYEVQTRWATALPHIIRLTADSSEWSIVFSGPGRFPEGRITLSPTGEGGTQGLVLEGATVRGAVLGALEVTRRSDSTFVDVVGTKAYQDTVPLEAVCRLGPISPIESAAVSPQVVRLHSVAVTPRPLVRIPGVRVAVSVESRNAQLE